MFIRQPGSHCDLGGLEVAYNFFYNHNLSISGYALSGSHDTL